jgi:hypothetical protein
VHCEGRYGYVGQLSCFHFMYAYLVLGMYILCYLLLLCYFVLLLCYLAVYCVARLLIPPHKSSGPDRPNDRRGYSSCRNFVLIIKGPHPLRGGERVGSLLPPLSCRNVENILNSDLSSIFYLPSYCCVMWPCSTK